MPHAGTQGVDEGPGDLLADWRRMTRSWNVVPVVSSASGREQVLLTRVVTECFRETDDELPGPHEADGTATGGDSQLRKCKAREEIVSARGARRQPVLAGCGCRSGFRKA